MKRIIIFLFLLISVPLFALTDTHTVLWDEYITLRDSMYNSVTSAEGLLPLYNEAVASAKKNFSDDTLYIALSRCEYIMGRAYNYESNKDMAEKYFDAGQEYAEKALDIKKSATAYLMLGETISQNCSVKPVSYVLSNGTKVNGFGKNALKLDPKYGAAKYLLSAQYIYAPAPFHNHKKGIKEMESILNDPNNRLEKDDKFNVMSAIGYGYIERKDTENATIWLKKSLEIYPSNKYVNGLLASISK